METYRFFDLGEKDETLYEQYPLYESLCVFGPVVLHVWGAACGCDWSSNGSGILGISEKTHALKNLKDKFSVNGIAASDPTLHDIATEMKLVSNGRVTSTISDIEAELEYIIDCYSKKGQYYTNDGRVVTMDGSTYCEASTRSVEHMNGESDPKTGDPFSPAQVAQLEGYDPSDSLHHSRIEHLAAANLPNGKTSVSDLKGNELKPMVLARGGSVTSSAGKSILVNELKQVAAGFMSIEEEVPSRVQYFDRNPQTNGVFARINTQHGANVRQILGNVCVMKNLPASKQQLAKEAYNLFHEGKFVTDTDKIILEAPEMTETMIQRTFIHAGYSTTEKKIQVSFQRALDTDDLVYHGNADVVLEESGMRYLYVMSKSQASYSRDEKTRKDTDPGEKPLPTEYFEIIRFIVESTTEADHGHTLGMVTVLDEAYCASCKAGILTQNRVHFPYVMHRARTRATVITVPIGLQWDEFHAV